MNKQEIMDNIRRTIDINEAIRVRSFELTAAMLTNAMITAELLNFQKGSPLGIAELRKEVFEMWRELHHELAYSP